MHKVGKSFIKRGTQTFVKTWFVLIKIEKKIDFHKESFVFVRNLKIA